MNIYIAAPATERAHAYDVQRLLEHYPDFHVTARWITLELFEKKDKDPVYLAEWAEKDLADVLSSDLLIALNDEAYRNKGSGGRHVEFGYALHANIPVIVVGARTNIFHWLKNVKFVENLAEMLAEVHHIYNETYK